MPTLDWIGKKAVLNHHNEVPFHLLREEPSLSVGDPGSGNLLVEGDNLLALKALEQENTRLRRAVADLTLDKLILQESVRGNF